MRTYIILLSNTRFHMIKYKIHVIKKKGFTPFWGAMRGLINLTLLTKVEGNIPMMLWANFKTNKLRTKRVAEFHVKIQVFPILGVKGGPIKLTLLIRGLDNITRKLLSNFETNKLRT